MRAKFLLAFFLFLYCTSGAFTFDINANCRKAYNSILALKLNLGQQMLDQEKKSHPDNLAPYFLEDYIDFLRIYLSGDKQLQSKLSKRADDRLSRLRAGDHKIPWYLYAQAEVLTHQAFEDIKFHEYASALWNIRKAYKMLLENDHKYPQFMPDNKSMGALKAMLGIIPSKYQWGLSLLGMEGNLSKGMEQLQRTANADFIFQREAITIYAMLLLHLESNPKEAWQVVEKYGLPVKGDLFSYFIAGNIAVYGKHNAEAIKILTTRPTGSEYEPIPYMDYLTGLAYLQQLNPEADQYFLAFLAKKGNGDFVKSAYHDLAWSALINQRPQDYQLYIQKCKTAGVAEVDADKQAEKEAESGVTPDTTLLKARLLFDGGYYSKALKVLSEKRESEYKTPEQQLELVYRKGRIYDESGEDSTAILCYRMTIYKGQKMPFFYAANAALQLGNIYEKRNDKINARLYFNKCLDLKGGEYENSLSNKARAGLERVK